MARRFEDQVAWITGGGSGIGRELALALGREGARVAVSGRREKRLEETVAELRKVGPGGIVVPCDVTEEEQVERAVASILEEAGRLDVAVANAGFGVMGRVESLSAADWRRQLETNVVGAAITARHALPALRETRGRMVLVGSVSAFVPGAKSAAYAASKAAVRMLGLTLALEVHGSGVTCTTLHPGFVKSEIAKVDNEGVYNPQREDRRPARWMWETEDAARTMVDAIHRRRREYVFTGHGKVGAFLGQHLPGLLHHAFTRGSGGSSPES